MKLPNKKYWVYIVLAASMAAMAAISEKQPEKNSTPVIQPSPNASRAAHASANRNHDPQRLPLGLLNRPISSVDEVKLFAARSWFIPPPPPPPPKPVPPPPPTAPPLPFTYLGKYLSEDAEMVFFLAKGDRLYTVPAGEIIDGIYRVEGISGGLLGLTYLPLNIKQSIDIGESS